jgi:hypothetical protein
MSRMLLPGRRGVRASLTPVLCRQPRLRAFPRGTTTPAMATIVQVRVFGTELGTEAAHAIVEYMTLVAIFLVVLAAVGIIWLHLGR